MEFASSTRDWSNPLIQYVPGPFTVVPFSNTLAPREPSSASVGWRARGAGTLSVQASSTAGPPRTSARIAILVPAFAVIVERRSWTGPAPTAEKDLRKLLRNSASATEMVRYGFA